MKLLSEIVNRIEEARLIGNPDTEIYGIERDSRKVVNGCLFVCIEGLNTDGHKFIPDAIRAGATAIMTNRHDVAVPHGVALLIVDNIQGALEKIVPFFYDYPSSAMTVIGVTGTNGKTTTTYLLRDIFRRAGKRIGLIGTIQILLDDEIIPTQNTTPDVVELQHIFAMMRDRGIDIVIMEVSSHALEQNRVAGIEFDTAIFTNLTQDHLDFHKTIENYAKAKAKLFAKLSNSQISGRKKTNKTAIVNIDDDMAYVMQASIKEIREIGYGLNRQNKPVLTAENIKLASDGMSITVLGEALGTAKLHINIAMTGIFNVYNLLGAIGAALANNISSAIIQEALNSFTGVAGRFELIRAGQPFSVVVDYAHTPDGMENVLKTAREVTRGRIIVVFGCGGDRDRTKRPIMGEIGAKLADIPVVTSDNPRTENPIAILEDIEVGVKRVLTEENAYEKITDRRQAIFKAIALAQDDDMVIILGKGHEDYQIIGNTKFDFDDRKVAREAIREKLGYGKDYCIE